MLRGQETNVGTENSYHGKERSEGLMFQLFICAAAVIVVMIVVAADGAAVVVVVVLYMVSFLNLPKQCRK